MQFKLPRWSKGTKITAEQLNELADAIERIAGLDVDGSSGLEIAEQRGVRTLRAVPPRVAIYAKVNTTITAMSGNTFGVGQIDRGYKDDDGVFQSYGGPPEDCFNSTSAAIGVGSIIQCKWIDDDWAIDVQSCGGS